MAVNFMLDATYVSILNPNNRRPERALRQLYQNNGASPPAIAVVITNNGILTVNAFALAWGDTDADARVSIETNTNLAQHWAPQGDLLRNAQVASYIAVRDDARQDRTAIRDARRRITLDPSAKPLIVAPDVKEQIRCVYKSSPAATYWPLELNIDPHDMLWDYVDTLRYKKGYMPFLFIYEIRSGDETIASASGLSKNLDGLVKVSDVTDMTTTVVDIADVLRRIVVYFVLASFLNECTLEEGIAYRSKFVKFDARLKPSLQAVIWADRTARLEVERLLKEDRGNYPTFVDALRYVRDHKLESQYFVESVQVCGVRARPSSLLPGSATIELPPGAHQPAVTVDGHQQPNNTGTAPIRPGTKGGALVGSQGAGTPSQNDIWLSIQDSGGGNRKATDQGGGGGERLTKRQRRQANLNARNNARGGGSPKASTSALALTWTPPPQEPQWRQALGLTPPPPFGKGGKGRGKNVVLSPGPGGKNAKGKGAKGKGLKGVFEGAWLPSKGKGALSAASSPGLSAEEHGWFGTIVNWTSPTNGKGICKFFNSAGGCARANACTFSHECIVCHQRHAAAQYHAIGTGGG